MEKKTLMFRIFFFQLLSVIFLFSICTQAQNYNSQDTTKTDTSKSNNSHMKKDTLGYNNINVPGNNSYSLNENIGNAYLRNSSMTDTSKTDTAYKKPDTLGYKGNGSYISAVKGNYRSNLYAQDFTKTDTSKTDTSWKKTDSLGYKNINSPNDSYAFEGNTGSNFYLQYDNLMTDTSNTDTTKSDTLGYNANNSNYYTYNGNNIYLPNDSTKTKKSDKTWKNKTDTAKTDTLGYSNNDSHYAYNSSINSVSNPVMKSHFLVNPIKDLTQKLKLNVYLMDAQTSKVQKILREYEAKTYQSNGDNEELNKAALNALNDITDILTVRQKKEWENAKNEWWASVNKALNLSSISKNRSDLQ